MIDILDAPFPYVIGMEPSPELDMLGVDNDVIRVDLDFDTITTPESVLIMSQIPKMPFREHKILKNRLMKAAEHIEQIPDPMMLEQVDFAFNVKIFDPDEEVQFDHLEVRDSFLEFMSSVMQGYISCIKDPSEQP